MKEMIKNTGIMLAITLIAGLVLGFIYQITKEPIAEQNARKKQEACQEVFQDAASFEPVEVREPDAAAWTAEGYGDERVDEDDSNKKEVIFHVMALRMHTQSETVSAIDRNIIKLIENTGTESEVHVLVEALNEIASILGEDLYGESMGEASNLNAFVAAISGSQEEPSEEEKLIEAAEEEKEDIATMKESSVLGWNEKIGALKSQGWSITPGNDSFTLTSASIPVVIAVYRKKGKYVVEATKEGDSDFSQKLKDNFKGSRRYGTWWRELPINNYGVTEGTLLAQLPTNDRARASVIKWIDKLTENITNRN